MLKSVSRKRSDVGRIAVVPGPCNTRPFKPPPTMRMNVHDFPRGRRGPWPRGMGRSPLGRPWPLPPFARGAPGDFCPCRPDIAARPSPPECPPRPSPASRLPRPSLAPRLPRLPNGLPLPGFAGLFSWLFLPARAGMRCSTYTVRPARSAVSRRSTRLRGPPVSFSSARNADICLRARGWGLTFAATFVSSWRSRVDLSRPCGFAAR